MKKKFTAAFWLVMYIIFLDLFAYNIILQGKWEPLSWATIYMCTAAVSLLNFGFWMDKKSKD